MEAEKDAGGIFHRNSGAAHRADVLVGLAGEDCTCSQFFCTGIVGEVFFDFLRVFQAEIFFKEAAMSGGIIPGGTVAFLSAIGAVFFDGAAMSRVDDDDGFSKGAEGGEEEDEEFHCGELRRSVTVSREICADGS